MARFDYNPLTNQLDLVDSPAGYINGAVADPTLLPVTLGTPALDSVFLAKAGSGLWLINRKPAGLYCRVANNGVSEDWQYLGAFPEVNADGNWELYNTADPTKELKFSLSNITTGTTRTLTVPNKSGTIATTDASDLTSGTLADARLSTNVPLKDAANTFSANQTLDGTNNVMPNQTAASGASIMTRDLVDASGIDTRIIRFRDDFTNGGRGNGTIGETGWSTSNAGGGTVIERTNDGVAPNHTSFRLTTGATASNYLRIWTANGLFAGSNPSTLTGWHAVCILALPSVADVTVTAGFAQNPSDIDFNRRLIGLRFKAGVDTNWQFVTKADANVYATSTLITLVDSGVAPVAGTFYKFEIRCVTAGTIEFRINSGSWLTSTTNIPTTLDGGLFYVLVGTQTSAAKTCDVDLVAWTLGVAR